MPTINDPTGSVTVTEVAGVLWSKTVYPSYRNYRSADARWFVAQGFGKFWWLYEDGQRRPGIFDKPEEAMATAAALSPKEAAA